MENLTLINRQKVNEIENRRVQSLIGRPCLATLVIRGKSKNERILRQHWSDDLYEKVSFLEFRSGFYLVHTVSSLESITWDHFVLNKVRCTFPVVIGTFCAKTGKTNWSWLGNTRKMFTNRTMYDLHETYGMLHTSFRIVLNRE